MVDIDRNDMVVLDHDDCLLRLGRGGIGRVAVVVGGLPAIFPVNYAVKGDHLYFLTGPGSKLVAAAHGAVMAFEVDHIDAFEHGGWSVVVVGRSSIVPASEVEPLYRLKLGRWVGGGPETQIRIQMDRVSGREIGRPGVEGWIPEFARE
jgi:nitroimidazol reductase NimA-like FMN-containing flavoprotein (pyridoxamine 5'-phosphate oxidase superfamily)